MRRLFPLLLIALALPAVAQEAPPNLALHCQTTLEPAPNYPYCTDANDPTQLTDGIFTGEGFWTKSTTVGWSVGVPVQITVDLGKDEPISGAAFSTAAGHGGVEWPWSIVVLTSLDGQTWQRAGDLARLDRQPPAAQLTTHIFRSLSLKTHGRHIRFLVGKLGYTFADEVEIYRGEQAWLAQPPAGREVTDMDAAAREAQGVNAMLERLRADARDAQEAIAQSNLPAADKLKLQDSAAQLAAEIETLPNELPAGFKTIMPFSDLQARLFALHAPLHRAAGLPRLTAWPANRWDMLRPTEAPTSLPRGIRGLRVEMLRGEHRAAAFNLTNATDEPVTAVVNVQGLPGGDNPAWISVREVLFSDTYVRQPIAAALPEAEKTPQGYRVGIPAGMTRQVWLQCDGTVAPVGEHTGRVAISSGPANLSLPLDLTVSKLALKPTDFALSGWDYTDTDRAPYDGWTVDQKLFISTMREFGVNMPWSGHAPIGARFDATGNLVQQPDYGDFDRWVGKWPGARHYAIFGLGENFSGLDPSTPGAHNMIAQWLRAWADHIRTLNLKPEQFCLLLLDEPNTPEQDERFIAWSEAVQAAKAGFKVWLDPCHEKPETVNPRLYEVCDILSPSGARFIGSPQSYRDFFERQRDAGRQLWFYNCVNGKHLDPIFYHRGTFWLNLRHGGRGVGFWAFGDEGRSGNSFQAYTAPHHMFSPLFFDPPRLIGGKHVEAIREGMQDVAIFAMLRERCAELTRRGVQAEALSAATKLLTDAPERVTQELTIDRLDWKIPKDRSLMDTVHDAALRALEALAAL